MKFVAIALMAAAALSAAPVKKKPAAKKTGASVGTSTVKRTAASTTKKKGRKGVTPAAPRQTVQAVPSSDRYLEIQRALATKGYLKTEPNGMWDQQSMDAMRQFQTEQNLSPTGKLSAATLIALGLGGSAPQSASSAPPVNSPAPPQ